MQTNLSSAYNLALGRGFWKLTEFSRHPKLLFSADLSSTSNFEQLETGELS